MSKPISILCLFAFLSGSLSASAGVNSAKMAEVTTNGNAQESTTKVISINLTDENDGWDDSASTQAATESENDIDAEEFSEHTEPTKSQTRPLAIESNTAKSINPVPETIAAWNNKLPGEEIHYRLQEYSNSNFLIDGKADSDIGKLRYQSRLMPSNEVKLSIKLKQKESDDIELIAYFDLANYTMELDGNKAVLNKDHKQLLSISSAHLQANYEQIYKDYDFPEHALMLVQMMSYWSVSPEGYQHAKRQIISKH